jgi:hypothetical protein
MSAPQCEGLIWESRYGRFLWRAQILDWNGETNLQLWPWYENKGRWCPCSSRYGTGGLKIPIEAVAELADALSAVNQANGAEATHGASKAG